jgi:ferredoxin--NADP+ reductase
LHLHFWCRPIALRGTDAVREVVVERTALADGRLAGTGESFTLASQLVLRAVGYRGVALSDVPFDDLRCTVPCADGRVLRGGAVSPGEYVAGWIGRGAVGVLGTNRSDADVVVQQIIEDVPSLPRRVPVDLEAVLRCAGVNHVDAAGWNRIDAAEIDLGAATDRPREKLASWDELLEAAIPVKACRSVPTPASDHRTGFRLSLA